MGIISHPDRHDRTAFDRPGPAPRLRSHCGGRSFTRAAALVGRTQSAVSMQLKRLEEILGQEVFQRSKGGSVELTPHGHYLLARARQILSLNDEVLATFHEPAIAGRV